MRKQTRRTTLKLLGSTTVLGTVGTTTAAATTPPKKGRIRKMGHSLLSDPAGGYAEEDIRADGKYALLGSFTGPGGSFLVDISNPTDPTEVHEVPTPSDTTRHADVAFDPRDGLYYRTLEGEDVGFEVIDYGFEEGTPEDPVLRATVADARSTHNLFPHPDTPVLYTANEDEEARGMDVWDVSDPGAPVELRKAGVEGGDLHDVVVDPERELAHCAYIGNKQDVFDGYQILDVSDPENPVEVGRFDYAGEPDYSDVPLGEEAFENCHYANYDPERELTVVGDEIGTGKPGGKHVFDVSDPSDPRPIGYTLSPNAEEMDDPDELFDWTGHNFDVIPKDDTTLLVSGDYHEGTVVYDITDPTDPTPTDQYRTDDKADQADGAGFVGDPPMAWGANYNAERDLVVTSDMQTGIYVFKVTPAAADSVGKGRGN